MKLLAKQSTKIENQDRLKNIFSYFQEDSQIILSKFETPYFSYIIFNPFNTITLKFFIDLINTNLSYGQQDYISKFIVQIIKLINDEYEKLKEKQLNHNQINQENILIFQSDTKSFLNMSLKKIKIKFIEFQDSLSQTSNDQKQIFQITEDLKALNDKIKSNYQNKQYSGNKEGYKIKQNINSKKEEIIHLINPFKSEYINKITQKFNEKLKDIDKSSSIEVLLWQQYYNCSLSLQNQECQLHSILNSIDMNIQIYRETQLRLQDQLQYETNLLNQFYQSQFRSNADQQLELEKYYIKGQENLKIYVQSEFVLLIKNKFPYLNKREFKLIAEDIIEKIWKQSQEKYLEDCFQLALNTILKTIQRFDDI